MKQNENPSLKKSIKASLSKHKFLAFGPSIINKCSLELFPKTQKLICKWGLIKSNRYDFMDELMVVPFKFKY